MNRAFVFQWTTFDGCVTQFTISGCTEDEALSEAIKSGWTPPKWWQWWRIYDFPRKARKN